MKLKYDTDTCSQADLIQGHYVHVAVQNSSEVIVVRKRLFDQVFVQLSCVFSREVPQIGYAAMVFKPPETVFNFVGKEFTKQLQMLIRKTYSIALPANRRTCMYFTLTHALTPLAK